MKIEFRKASEILPYEYNPRLNDAAIDAVARSIEAFGFKQPVILDSDGVIVCGHTRWKAAKKIGMETIPVIVAKDLTPEQVRAYRVADNKTNELSDWDYHLLPHELQALNELDFDLSSLGFSEKELAQLLDPGITDGLTDPDEIPEPPDDPITQPGDLWILGNHRLLCGDSAKTEDVGRLLDGAEIQLVNSDPPYGVCVEPRSKNAIAAGNSSFRGDKKKRKPGGERSKMRAKDRPLKNDFVTDEAFQELLLSWFGNISRVLEPGRSYYIWGGYSNLGNYPPALQACELYYSQAIVWDKEWPVVGRKDFLGCFELAFYGWKEGAAHQFFGPNNAMDLWHVKKITPQKMCHLTEKPTELAVRAIQYSSQAGENVLDLFGGSGSTLIACEQTSRKAFLMELDCAYADVICQRWENFTGKKAERVGTKKRSRRRA